VVGEEELRSSSVNVRNRDDPAAKSKGTLVSLVEISTRLTALKTSRSLENKLT
jgi:threonyl-tRNA synthetase